MLTFLWGPRPSVVDEEVEGEVLGFERVHALASGAEGAQVQL